MMLNKKGMFLTASLLFAFIIFLSFNVSFAQGHKKPLTIEGKKFLPLRVLSRAFSKIYKAPDVKSEVVEDNIPAFQAYFVYAKKEPASDLETTVWYQVGTDNRGHIVGWMNSDDVFEWKQTMCLSYTHPEGRHPVLMFENKEELKKYLSMPAEERKKAVQKLYEQIEKGQIPKDFPVVTVEPKMAVDITKEFYLLPILSFEEVEIDNREARLLKLAAVTKASEKARVSSDIRKNKEYLQEATIGAQEVIENVAKNLSIDLVWVMDTTNSMQPYIDKTVEVIKETSKRLSDNPEVGKSIHFGFWGYRDSLEIPGIEYDVKNFTPKLQNINDFINTLKGVKAATVGSKGYAEDMFSGVYEAINNTAWTPNAIRVIILVGDAPSHELGHKWNKSKMSDSVLRIIADDEKITIFALHIKDPQAKKYHAITEEQFKTLSNNPGVENPSYFSAPSDDLGLFSQATKDITNTILSLVEKAKQFAQKGGSGSSGNVVGGTNIVSVNQKDNKNSNLDLQEEGGAKTANVNLDLFEEEETTESKGNGEGTTKVKDIAKGAMKAAFVKWIGSQAKAQAPRDVVAWVTDKDLMESDIQALEVRLLINKRQLDSLRQTLETILKAGRAGQISGDDFFSALQAAAATTARDPEMIKRAKSLAETGLVPEFLIGLPYHSRIMDMTNELWNSWSVDEQDNFLMDLEARIMAYETIHDSPEGWVQLNKDDDPGDYVYPITLDLLP